MFTFPPVVLSLYNPFIYEVKVRVPHYVFWYHGVDRKLKIGHLRGKVSIFDEERQIVSKCFNVLRDQLNCKSVIIK